jgi:hypothetical protein
VPATDREAVLPYLPHWWVNEDVEPQRVWTVPFAEAAESVVRELELWVAEHAVDLVFVHAGVVAVDGRALLLPGRSLSGKTTLTAALLRAGASYGSDEYAVLSADGLVQPYPRPLAIRGPQRRDRVPAAELGAATFTGPLPIAGVAVLRYQEAASWQVAPISPGVTVLRLLDNTVCAQSRPREALDALVAATATSWAIEGARGDAEVAVPRLLAWSAEPPPGEEGATEISS